MHGTDLQLLDIKRTWTLKSGRFFTEREQKDAAQVIVLGQVVAEKLFGTGVDPVGQTITLWKQPFTIVDVAVVVGGEHRRALEGAEPVGPPTRGVGQPPPHGPHPPKEEQQPRRPSGDRDRIAERRLAL